MDIEAEPVRQEGGGAASARQLNTDTIATYLRVHLSPKDSEEQFSDWFSEMSKFVCSTVIVQLQWKVCLHNPAATKSQLTMNTFQM